MQQKYYIYILSNYTNTVLYVGITNDLIRRVWEHKQKLAPGFTARYHVDKLVYFEEFTDSLSAIAREKQVKGGSRKKKLSLIVKENQNFEDLYEKIL